MGVPVPAVLNGPKFAMFEAKGRPLLKCRVSKPYQNDPTWGFYQPDICRNTLYIYIYTYIHMYLYTL